MSNALTRVQVLRDFWRITRREEAYLRDRTSDSECKLTAPLASIIIVVFISGAGEAAGCCSRHIRGLSNALQ